MFEQEVEQIHFSASSQHVNETKQVNIFGVQRDRTHFDTHHLVTCPAAEIT